MNTNSPRTVEWALKQQQQHQQHCISFAFGLRICLGMIIKWVAMLAMKNIHSSSKLHWDTWRYTATVRHGHGSGTG